MDTGDHFDASANNALVRAVEDAKSRGHDEVHPVHLFRGVVGSGGETLCTIYRSAGTNPQEMLDNLEKIFPPKQGPAPTALPTFAEWTKQVLLRSQSYSDRRGRNKVSAEDLFLTLVSDTEMERVLRLLGIDAKSLSVQAKENLGLAPQ